jgi:Ca-activated chloride channel homolog
MTPVKLGAACGLLCATIALAQTPALRVEIDLVLLQATVTDKNNNYIKGLSQTDFQVWEDKIEQKVEYFYAENVPVSVAIIFDVSGSMEKKLQQARLAANTFLKLGDEEDEYLLIEFSDSARIVQDFTSDITKLQNRILFSAAKGNTSLYDALYLALDKVSRDGSNARKAVIVITDGQDNHSRYSFTNVRDFAREHDVMIYGIGIEDRADLLIGGFSGRLVLRSLSEMTGGSAYFPDSIDSLPEICERIGVDLKNQYVLGYRSHNAARDGKWRKLQVKVDKAKGRLIVRAKNGYYASAAEKPVR